ncbi:MAG: hypothetical protein PHY72_04320 [Candidatus Pacebacteria bacterium]|nr:hypothetical protein [Candidatus Paceibacterota bacterium]
MEKLSYFLIGAIVVILAFGGWAVHYYRSQNSSINKANQLALNNYQATSTLPVDSSVQYNQQNWTAYDNAQYGFTLKYPADIALIKLGDGSLSYDWESFTDFQGVKIAQVFIPQSFEPNTNFSGAWVNIGQSSNPQAVANCLNPYPNPSAFSEQAATTSQTINNIVFSVSLGVDAGNNNTYKFTGYRTIRNNQCFAVNLVVHYSNFQNYPQGVIQEFNYNKAYSLLNEILQTFTFINI